jgi:hypothetical protein
MSIAEPPDHSPYRGYRFPSELIAHAVWLNASNYREFRTQAYTAWQDVTHAGAWA